MTDIQCCRKMREKVEQESIWLRTDGYWIYGKPEFAYDGDGIFDDMTAIHQIHFCPFCGAALLWKKS